MTRTRLTFAALAALSLMSAEVTVKDAGNGRVDVEIDGKPYTSLFAGPETTKPYLHPVRAASGTIVSRMYPMEKKEGEVTDHIHQRGLWFTHGDVNKVDFWANDPSQQGPTKGKIVLDKVIEAKGGPNAGTIVASFKWVDASGKTLLTDVRRWVIRANPRNRIIDFQITLTGVEKARFNDTKEGVMAIRLATEMDGKHTGKMVNAAGAAGERAVWGKPSPWVDYSGTIAGEKLGVAIFDHPTNPKHPTHWHSRDYGLFAANIFGEHDFYNDKSRDGGMVLEPGKTWRFSYRIVIHPGDHNDAKIGDMYQRWTNPQDRKK
jgi:hypothetical protein